VRYITVYQTTSGNGADCDAVPSNGPMIKLTLHTMPNLHEKLEGKRHRITTPATSACYDVSDG
jgi:hypothetical protein